MLPPFLDPTVYLIGMRNNELLLAIDDNIRYEW